ncbi:MAG: hypothetical protein Q8L90_02715 [Bacteroidota bacterium]|nr:hypothetical protein [Bacteroidota bacterium]
MKREENPNKLKKIKISDEIAIPIGNPRLTRKRKLIFSIFLKTIWMEINPINNGNNNEKKSII